MKCRRIKLNRVQFHRNILYRIRIISTQFCTHIFSFHRSAKLSLVQRGEKFIFTPWQLSSKGREITSEYSNTLVEDWNFKRDSHDIDIFVDIDSSLYAKGRKMVGKRAIIQIFKYCKRVHEEEMYLGESQRESTNLMDETSNPDYHDTHTHTHTYMYIYI